MMRSIMSPFQLIDLEIFESEMIIDIDLIEHPPNTKDMPFEIKDVFTSHESEGNTKSCELRMSVSYQVFHEKIKGSRKRPNRILGLKCGLRGIVSAEFEDDVTDGERDYLLYANAISLLYAATRLHWFSLTAVSPIGKLVLPTIDPFAYVDNAKENEVKATE